MRSVKAIVAGSAFIIIVMILLQLAYVFIAVAYNALAVDFPILNDMGGVFRYLVGIPVFLATMFAGGYITASVADSRVNRQVWFHCLTVGFLTVGGMLFSAMINASLTLTGVVIAVLALSAASAGGLYWLRGSVQSQDAVKE